MTETLNEDLSLAAMASLGRIEAIAAAAVPARKVRLVIVGMYSYRNVQQHYNECSVAFDVAGPDL
jgi:hypothetical protein